MPNGITPNVFNPASVVKTISRPSSGESGENSSAKSPDSAVKVEVSPQISALSRAKAAAGDNQVSAETAQAIAEGKLPPQVQVRAQEIPQEAVQAAEETATIQRADAVAQVTNPEGLQPEPVENIEALTRAAQAFSDANALSGEAQFEPAAVQRLITPPVADQTPAPVAAPAVQTQDTATAALGNTADITV